MKKFVALALVAMFILVIAGVAVAQPAWKQAGELPPGLSRKAILQQPSTLAVTFDSGEVVVVEGSSFSSGMVIHYVVSGSGVIVNMVAEQDGRVSVWEGNGEEYADMSEFDEAQWVIVWTSGGAVGRGKQILTIGYAEGIMYEEPIDEEPIDEPIE